MPGSQYKLFGDQRSGNCYKVALLLKMTGKEFAWIETDVLNGETRTPEFLEMNPNGRVPLLRLQNGSCLAESNAILVYLARGTPYLPKDWYQQALVLQWLFFEQYSHEPYIAVARFLLHFDHGMDIDPERIKMLHERGLQALGVMEEILSKQEFIAGEQFTIADIALYAYTHVAGDGGFDTASMAAVGEWMKRVKGQPGHFDMQDMPL